MQGVITSNLLPQKQVRHLKKRLFILLFLFFSGLWSFAQNATGFSWGGEKQIRIPAYTDTLLLDSFYVRPTTLVFRDADSALQKPVYELVQDSLARILFSTPPEQPLILSYKTLGVRLGAKVYRKPRSLLLPAGTTQKPGVLYRAERNSAFAPFDGLNSRGSISRSISVGNNQDAVLNSSLNLQLSGNLGKQTQIRASITDNSIPVQADGYTQQLREFDRVYIELENAEFGLIRAGDYNMINPNYLLHFDKRISGASVFSNINLNNSKVPLRVEGGLARGRFARNRFQGQEGNQGPYKLRGNNDELFIIIISGSERVYIDGNLLTRGQQYDYVIDYNAGEITFTALRPITKESRIVVEFQYTEQNYLRSVVFGATGFENEKLQTQVQFYSEQDSPNQPLTGELNTEEKQLLSGVGDQLNQAVVSTIRPATFDPGQVFYELRDSLGFDSVLVFSVDSTQPLYQASFAFVGNNQGDYIQAQNNANGRVFRWVPPQNGVPQGNFAPQRLLASPNLLQVLNTQTVYTFNAQHTLSIDLAASRNDINLFSDIGKENDIGLAGRLSYRGESPLEKGKLISQVGIEFNEDNFTTIERIRTVEFARDWALPLDFNEGLQMATAGLGYALDTSSATYQLQYLSFGGYTGLKQEVTGRLKSARSVGQLRASWLEAGDSLANSTFLREKLRIRHFYAPRLWTGVFSEGEWNTRRFKSSDTLTQSSYRFLDVGALMGIGDTAANFAELWYSQRFDDTAQSGRFVNFSQVQAVGLEAEAKTRFNSVLNTRIFSRSLKVYQPEERDLERTVTARFNYIQRLFKNAIVSTTFYESGSGTEARRVFNYIEVPAGTGVYTHTDYNGNGIQELDEFEVAPQPDLARYVRVFLPTNDFLRTNLNKFSEIINLNAPFSWQNARGIKKILSRFSLLSNYQLDRKTLLTGATNNLNPFAEVTDDSLIVALNNSFRNTLYFNRTQNKFGIDYTYRTSDNRNLLSFGVEQRTVLENTFNLRWQLIEPLQLRGSFSAVDKENLSTNFSRRNFTINQRVNRYALAYQPNDALVLTATYAYEAQNGSADDEISLKGSDIGFNCTYNLANSLSLQSQLNYILNNFEGNSNNPAAFEMLRGLQPGRNGTWNLVLQKTIRKSILLSLNYSGRISEDNPVIQTANVQVKAFF